MKVLLFDSSTISTWDELLVELQDGEIEYDIPEIERAYDYALRVHGEQVRKSGEPYIIHPLTVAVFTLRLGLGTVSVISALLHDVVEDTSVSIDDVDEVFGTEVAYIVDGMSNMKRQANQFATHDESVQEVQHLLIKSAGDIRVLLIRLADKLHNALTLKYLKPHAQIRFAKGVQLIFAPLADYIGLGYFKKALDDISFQILEPEKYQMVADQFEQYRARRDSEVEELINSLEKLMSEYQIRVESIYGRAKGIYSTYRKLKRYAKDAGIEELNIDILYDAVAVSVIATDVEQCYMVLGLIHKRWEYIDDRFKDYVVNPKVNGYSAIHTAIYLDDEPVEIQIKTREMHDFNEFGPASHIAYKLLGNYKQSKLNFNWVKNLNAWKDDGSLDDKDYRVETFEHSIFVFTPKGAVKRLDTGSTPIDFAYQIHSDLGTQFAGAKVNGKLVSMNTVLKTGDIVEVICDKRQRVAKRDWIRFARMSSTKYKIRRSIRRSSGEQVI